jgi:hypothetical protein
MIMAGPSGANVSAYFNAGVIHQRPHALNTSLKSFKNRLTDQKMPDIEFCDRLDCGDRAHGVKA